MALMRDGLASTPRAGGLRPLTTASNLSATESFSSEIMVFLHGNGVSTSRAVRIFKTYGQDAISIVTENPYRLARDIRGIGFLSADTIAQKIGIAHDSPLRARAGVSYALSEAVGEGHCGLPRSQLVSLAVKLLEIPQPIIEDAIDQELAEEVVIAPIPLTAFQRFPRAVVQRRAFDRLANEAPEVWIAAMDRI